MDMTVAGYDWILRAEGNLPICTGNVVTSGAVSMMYNSQTLRGNGMLVHYKPCPDDPRVSKFNFQLVKR